MRLDKLLANMGFGSRKDVKLLLKKKHAMVNDVIVTDGSMHIDPKEDRIMVNNAVVRYQKYVYIMMNKPRGVISATEDMRDKTVIDLLPLSFKHFNPFPAGRLDKDTEGLMILTNDGEAAYRLTAPKTGVEKVYIAEIKGRVTPEDGNRFQRGIELEDGYKTKPAQLEILKTGSHSKVKLTITEGKFHQVKRMFEAVGKRVIHLKRIQMGQIRLDEALRTGAVREFLPHEEDYCLSLKKGTKR